MSSLPRSIRRNALAKIAELSATSSNGNFEGSDIERLCRVSPGNNKLYGRVNGINNDSPGSLAGSPMNIREFEVLLALCKAAPLIDNTYSAEKLTSQLSPYVLEAHTQLFVQSPLFRAIEPSPVEALSYNLTTALLSIGTKHRHLQKLISEKLSIYLDNCVHASEIATENRGVSSEYATEIEEAIHVATVTISLLGFLDAVASLVNFWSAKERLDLCERVKAILSEGFLVAVETAFSTIRNTHLQSSHVKEWKRYVRHYAAIGRPLGAMLLQRSFMWLLVAGSSLLLVDVENLKDKDVLSVLMSHFEDLRPNTPRNEQVDPETVNTLANIASNEISLLEDGADYLRLGSAWQQRLAFSVKASALTTYMNCAMLSVTDDEVEPETLMSWLEDTLADPVQMADDTLANVVLRSMALVSKLSPQLAPEVSRLLPRFIVQGNPQGNTNTIASACLAYVLNHLSQDAIITTLYTLGNVLNSGASHPEKHNSVPNGDLALDGAAQSNLYGKNSNGSSISLEIFTEEDTSTVYGNVVQAICAIAQDCQDPKIIALAQSMLLQKIDKINQLIDARIITAAAELSLCGGPLEFRSLLKLYGKITHLGVMKNNEIILHAIMKGRNLLSSRLQRDTPLYNIYLENLLEDIISKGDVHQGQNTREGDVEAAAKEIAQLLQPLAIFFSTNNMASNNDLSEEMSSLVRDAWFNIVVHGFTTNTERGQLHLKELRILAIHSKPLVAEQRGEQVESDIELNTVLRRGISQDHETTQKKRLTALLPSRAREIGALSYRKVIFLQAAYLVETLRADAGDCSKALTYFLEPSMRRGEMSSTMEAVTAAVMETYLRKSLTGLNPTFSAPHVAKQLASIFTGCCYRIERVQQAAMNCADRIIRDVPSALCQKSSLFALLEILSLLWVSCLEAETDEYGLRSSFTSSKGHITIEMSDDYGLRRRTLDALYKKAKGWVTAVINIAPANVKGLLQTYLSEYDDEGAYGHISLGRSFASEMGTVIPSMDQRLEAIDRHGECNINTASDFIAQYTTRQEYRYAEALPDHNAEWLRSMHLDERRPSITSKTDKDCDDAVSVLSKLEAQIHKKKHIAITEIRDVLRRAAALLCRSDKDECAIIRYLVSIPFAILPSSQLSLGFFVLLSSHFNATRLGSPHTEKTFLRILDLTLDSLKHSTGHPLAREIRFQIVLFGLRVLRHTTTLDLPSKYRLKDKILSAALSWFTFAPRWSFGGNRLQLKAETRLLNDVVIAFRSVTMAGSKPTAMLQLMQAKEELLHVLIESEQIRLNVWLDPLRQGRDIQVPAPAKVPNDAALLPLVKTAWNENPSLAIQLVSRFPSARLHQDVRLLLLQFPDKAISEPEAVHILLGDTLPSDVAFQMKYLLYWAPVNPISAVTYFLPSYRNHPFIVQYAMRALESHSVDVTFFYVPQIVQTLRYDDLGYVERYIVETAKFSQLFAHQIIWNMKANAFKDEDSLIPDVVKPTLDKVTNRMIESFSGVDKAFYEREFTFFDEVTSISGKLKPYIKRPKPEKKQKIEEELRKIKVEIGVYLPSNPDGVVIGIDRQSGKPLQSHAKAPYMATFRIKKSIGADMEGTDDMLEETNKNGGTPVDNSIEIWQSAIFKVGDDCRQDVLALQMIAAFRGIFNSVGLDVYVFHIVLLRQHLVVVLLMFYQTQSRVIFWEEKPFQEARANFVKSMAAYSIISFLLQFKDRHNGNIMIDDAGHILHIDFGFCFDIAPGGVKFERAPFKLTTEMVAVMGGSTEHQAFKWFEELCVKAYLASRPYTDKLSQLVMLMMDSGLPCFKPESIQHFRDRFVLEKTEAEAALFMRSLVKRSYGSYSTGVYDQFQLLTNGIPY
ncbi:phosphatidylinositol 3 [Botrytis cinerea]